MDRSCPLQPFPGKVLTTCCASTSRQLPAPCGPGRCRRGRAWRRWPRRPVPGPPRSSGTVTTGPARSLGEPAAAQDTAVSAVAATTFGPAGAQVSGLDQARGRGVLDSGGPGACRPDSGPVTTPPPRRCAERPGPRRGRRLATRRELHHQRVRGDRKVYSEGRLGPPQLVSDQRGTGRFDDRPVVAAGPDGTVWVAWSQGTDADACQNVGHGDQIEVAVSRDGGRTFGAPVALPRGRWPRRLRGPAGAAAPAARWRSPGPRR